MIMDGTPDGLYMAGITFKQPVRAVGPCAPYLLQGEF